MFFYILGHQMGGNGPGRHLASFLEAVAPSWLNMGPRRANENSVPGLMQPLVTAAIDVNVRISPRMRKWRALLATARWAAHCGTKGQVLLTMARMAGETPLMTAALVGKVAETKARAIGTRPVLNRTFEPRFAQFAFSQFFDFRCF